MHYSWYPIPDPRSGINDFKREPTLKLFIFGNTITDFFVDRNLSFLFLKKDTSGCSLQIETSLSNSKLETSPSFVLPVPHSSVQGCQLRDSGYGTFLVEMGDGKLHILKQIQKTNDYEFASVPKIDYPKDRGLLNRIILVQTQDLIYYLYLY